MPALAASPVENPPPNLASLNAILAPYKEPSLPRSLGQLADTALPLFALWALMHWLTALGWVWPVLLLCVPAAGLLMRLFIIQHDCGHGAFFSSTRANDILGVLLAPLTLSPYRYWRQTHAIHHATSGNLDKRGWGDINILTVREYNALPPRDRWFYRIYRSAPMLFLFGPAFHFIFYHRYPGIVPADWKRERLSILGTDAALAALFLLASKTVGLGPFLFVHVPVWILASSAGVWFFYVQHQFEKTYWRRDKDWDFTRACLEGSSYYQLPRLLQWLTGNIGFHHIHHLNSRIPNYRLQACMEENPVFQKVTRLTLRDSLKCVSLTLWDEEKGLLVGFPAHEPPSRRTP